MAVEHKPSPYNPRVKLKPKDFMYKALHKSLNDYELVQLIVWNRLVGGPKCARRYRCIAL